MGILAESAGREITCDTLFDGHIHCCQHRNGYRFSVDTVLVAQFSCPDVGARVLDLGCGSGVIGLIMSYRWAQKLDRMSCLELQPQLAELARHNASRNGFADLMTVENGDYCQVLDHFPAESFDQVVCNPPFFPVSNGRPSQNREAFVARHQVYGGLREIAAAAASVCRHRGRVTMVYPAQGLVALITALTDQQLIPKRLQHVYSYPHPANPARLVLVEAVKNGGESLTVLPPLYINERAGGPYTPEMQCLYDAGSLESVPL